MIRMSPLRRVVITGLGVCTPIGLTVDTFWQNLLRGVSGLQALPATFQHVPSRVAGIVTEDELIKAQEKAQQYFSEQHSGFVDWRTISRANLFGILAAKQALTQAGFHPINANSPERSIGERAGVYFGAGLEGVSEVLETGCGISEGNYKTIGPYALTRSLANMPAGMISRLWGLRGPCMVGNTACATGSHSIGDAYRMIQHGEADLVVAGGCEASINLWTVAAFSRIRALATQFNSEPTAASRPFDAQRNGFVMSEGAGAVVLQAWPPAPELAAYCNTGGRKTMPIAEVVGYGRSCDAYNLVSPDPSGDGARRSILAALKDAGLQSVHEIGHINCHATSTPLGDAIELTAIARLIHEHSHHSTGQSASSPILISSIKGHTGHSLAAAGAIETVCTALSVSRGFVPGTRNLHQPVSPEEIGNLLTKHPDIPSQSCMNAFRDRCFLPGNDQPQIELPPTTSNIFGKRRIALKNSFGFGGTNASLVLAEWKE